MAEGEIYSATYSNVPVYELKLGADHVMRRRSDDWVNATHILKIAGFDKPSRTRILEKDVQRGVHEKIQGGYGKYQGTWIPLPEGRVLAEKNNCLHKIRKIFDFVPGDRSPPPAPKHTTAASSRPKVPKNPNPPRKVQPSGGYYPAIENHYDSINTHYNENGSYEEVTPETSSMMADDELMHLSQHTIGSRKRKRDPEPDAASLMEQEFIAYGDSLLDYFETWGDGPKMSPPIPPEGMPLDRPIEDQGNTALHWACSMGDVEVARDLIQRGANPGVPNMLTGETPLIRAVLFTNNFDRRTFPRLLNLLQNTIIDRDNHGATVFHHIAELGRSRRKLNPARYYAEVLINKLLEGGTAMLHAALTLQDQNHDTAVLCAVRNKCLRLAQLLLTHVPEAGDMPNLNGDTANDIMRTMSSQHQSLEPPPSSPLAPGMDELSFKVDYDSKNAQKAVNMSNAAATMRNKMNEVLGRISSFHEAESKEKDLQLNEAQATLSDMEAQRHRIRQETYALMARAPNDNELHSLRASYSQKLRQHESLLEQKDHSALQAQVLAQDQQTPSHLFRDSNNDALSQEEMKAAIPWARELHSQQHKRRQLIQETAQNMGDVGASERIGKLRKLVSMATGIQEDNLDDMSAELLESLDPAHTPLENGPRTPPMQRAAVS
ncbi:MAG: hypothetical protein Q9227_003857 [Pyrenula ochraceoflavens]